MSASLFNFNVGVLGHVDSGKTSLSKALSTIASTACFDKNPQSKERGITLDLGFSSFSVDTPVHLKDVTPFEKLQFTLVDCPGHASLIRTIIGGSQIIDLMMLVVDVTKGIQTQTAECLIIGEITCEKIVVVLNKVDLLPEGKREAMIDKMTKRLLKTLEPTRFADSPIVSVAAKPGGPESDSSEIIGVTKLIDTLKSCTYIPKRDPQGAFIFSVDHCFLIRGQGTVMTGTVINGSARINDTVEIPALKVTKKVKSMQMFKRPVDKVVQGDRVGICVTQFDPQQLERGLICAPGALPTIEAAIISVHKISYYKGKVATKAKFHVTMGHETVMGKVTFFGYHGKESDTGSVADNEFDYSKDYLYQDELFSKQGKNVISNQTAAEASADDASQSIPVRQLALVEFEKPVTCSRSCLVIGSKLDTDIHANMCRIAFHGQLLEILTDVKYAGTVLPKLKVYKIKTREGQVERVMDDYTIIGRNLFKKESNIQPFVNLKVTLSSGEKGIIEGGFGQSGKFKVRIPDGVSKTTKDRYAGIKKKGKGKVTEESANQNEAETKEAVNITLTFKRYIFDPSKKMIQS